ncbi:hypothetical protein [Oceanobacter mangrovi]|uniref:hypothetical protein n=1 Tax=Oceanobacter mangrovi TaxID=2862510 RepID=UPI001C8DEB8F|nr:hypothetical protein [Oceanobacter mangrovi]
MITITTNNGGTYRVNVRTVTGRAVAVEAIGPDLYLPADPVDVSLETLGAQFIANIGPLQLGPIDQRQADNLITYLKTALEDAGISWQTLHAA